MSHDAWAAFSAVELARDCQTTPTNWFSGLPPWEYQTYATRDPNTRWPHPDGAIEIAQVPDGTSHLIAVEFKRTNESIHGVLTGLGQTQAYLHKGFSASVLVLPARYDSLETPGQYAAAVIERCAPNSPVGVFTYDEPDLAHVSPFAGRLRCHRSPGFNLEAAPTVPERAEGAGRQRTQWAHVREGSTVPDALFRYLQTVRSAEIGAAYTPTLPADLSAGVERVSPGADPVFYLSNTSKDRPRRPLADSAWRQYWLDRFVIPLSQRIGVDVGGSLVPDTATTLVQKWDGNPIQFFSGRSDSIKARLVARLNAGTVTTDHAWNEFAQNIRDRAHQFREDIDSNAEAAGFVDADGRLTEFGFRFVSACEKAGSATSPQAIAILRLALLTKGGYLALLHYIHSISDRIFHEDQLRFFHRRDPAVRGARSRFLSVEYRELVYHELTHTLRVAGRSAARGGRGRPPLEGEFITMRHLGLVQHFRAGVGLVINWPAVHAALEGAS